MNPQLVNEITMGNYPARWMSTSPWVKPVVATHTGTMELFSEHVYPLPQPRRLPAGR